MIPDWLELRSASLMVSISGFFMTLVLASQARAAWHVPGFPAWLGMAFLTPCGLALNNLQGVIPAWLAYPVGLSLLNTGVWLAWVGTRQFMGLTPRWWLTSVVAAGTFASAWYFGLISPSGSARVLTVSPIHAWVTATTAWMFWRRRDADLRFALRFASVPMAVFAVVSVARTWAALSAEPSASGLARTPTNTLAYLVGGSAMLCTYTGVIMCINALMTRDVRRQADHDDLTGLLNRHGFTRRFASWQAAHPWGSSIALIDVDHFKHVNDTLGHAEGDRLLAALGAILNRLAGDRSVVCRLGGDEFALLAPDLASLRATSEASAREFSRHCQHVYADTLTEPHPTLSVGVATVGTDLSGSLKAADTALYRAKSDGRNRISGLANASPQQA